MTDGAESVTTIDVSTGGADGGLESPHAVNDVASAPTMRRRVGSTRAATLTRSNHRNQLKHIASKRKETEGDTLERDVTTRYWRASEAE
jgi:hypothetical protein